jgi:integrase
MYYAALRPEEAINLRKDQVTLPPLAWNDSTKQWEEPAEADGWGKLHLRNASPDVGREWTDGTERETRQLKHRANGETRPVPIHPELVKLLRAHLEDFGTADDGRLFTGVRSPELPTITYRRAWTKARQAALTPQEQASPLAKRHYDLRHACVSTWLNSGVAPTQVAEWAGHSLNALLRI